MYDFHIEPRLADALADPIVLAVMMADRIDPQIVADDMRSAAHRITARGIMARGIMARGITAHRITTHRITGLAAIDKDEG